MGYICEIFFLDRWQQILMKFTCQRNILLDEVFVLGTHCFCCHLRVMCTSCIFKSYCTKQLEWNWSNIWWRVCLHHRNVISCWVSAVYLSFLLSVFREVPLRRLALAVVIPPCHRCMPRLPPTPHQVKVRQHLRVDCPLLTLALHMPVQSILSIPSSESIRALSTTGLRPWHPITR